MGIELREDKGIVYMISTSDMSLVLELKRLSVHG